MTVSSGFLRADDGASLYYELRGTVGPLVLIISGGMGTAQAHERTSTLLSQRFRVITYDRRGFYRSHDKNYAYDDIEPPDVISRNAEDAACLIRHFARDNEGASIWGSCLAGAIALQLLQSHPELVKIAVIHEPAVPLLVSEPERSHIISVFDSMRHTYRDSGGKLASRNIMALINDAASRKALQQSGDYERLVSHSAQHMTHHYLYESKYALTFTIDWDVLRAQRDKIVLAIGKESHLPLQTEPTICIAKRLALKTVTTPGAHFPFSVDRRQTVDLLVSLFGQPALESVAKL